MSAEKPRAWLFYLQSDIFVQWCLWGGMTGRWETNMITPLRFSDNRRRGRGKRVVACDVFVEYKPRVRGAAVIKRQHKKSVRERKMGEEKELEWEQKKKLHKIVRVKWEGGGVGAQSQWGMKEMRVRHRRGGEKYRIAEGENELCRRAEWIADNVSERAAGKAWF